MEVRHAIDTVGSLGFRDTALIAVRLIMGIEAFFDAAVLDRSHRHDADGRRPPGPPTPTDRRPRCTGALYQRCPAVVEHAIQTFTNAAFAAPPLHHLLQTLPGQDGHRVVMETRKQLYGGADVLLLRRNPYGCFPGETGRARCRLGTQSP